MKFMGGSEALGKVRASKGDGGAVKTVSAALGRAGNQGP